MASLRDDSIRLSTPKAFSKWNIAIFFYFARITFLATVEESMETIADNAKNQCTLRWAESNQRILIQFVEFNTFFSIKTLKSLENEKQRVHSILSSFFSNRHHSYTHTWHSHAAEETQIKKKHIKQNRLVKWSSLFLYRICLGF